MVFSSHVFVFWFLPLALAAYYGLPVRFRHLAMTVLSYAFYGWANPVFVLLMFGSNLFDYVIGLALAGRLAGRGRRLPIELLPPGGARTGGQKAALALSIAGNLAVLGFFKYFNFGVDSYNRVVGALGATHWRWEDPLQVILPLGISFSVFQSMSYTIDVYRGEARAMRNFTDFSYYVSMFPQMVAGPIVRFSEIDDQMLERTHTREKFARGVSFLALGMAKKVLVANPCGKLADTAFAAGSLHPLEAWTGAVAYAFQIYFDFSGYSDMAVGLGLFFGFVLPKNFDSPYHARSITEFWRRWHISLSTWLRDYLYRPLGGNRKGAVRTYVNLTLVMLLGGLWHGASWNFVVWGAIHGGMLVLERRRGKEGAYGFLPAPLRVAWTFLVVLVSWVFFRAEDLPRAVAYLRDMCGLGEPQAGAALVAGVLYTPYHLLMLATAALVVWTAPQAWDWTRRLTAPRVAACVALLWLSLVAIETQSFNPFIYFFF